VEMKRTASNRAMADVSTDSEIIRRSVDEPAAFAEIFERHARVIVAYAARRVGVHAAEDVLSETFLVAFRRRGDFDASADSAKPWLFGIASRHIARHRAREAQQWRAIEAATGLDAGADERVPAADARVDAEAALRELAPRIAALPERDRDILLLHAWGDLTFEEIALAQGIPAATVRTRMHRLRKRLAAHPSRIPALTDRNETE